MASGSQHKTMRAISPPDGAFTVCVGAHEFGDVPNGRGLGFSLTTFSGQISASA